MSVVTLNIGLPYEAKDPRRYPSLAVTAQTYHSSEVSVPKPDSFLHWRGIYPDHSYNTSGLMRPVAQRKSVTGEFSNPRRVEAEVAYQYGMDIMVSTKGNDTDEQLRGYKTDTFRAFMDDRVKNDFPVKFFQYGNEIDFLDRPDLGLESWNHPAKAVAWADRTVDLLDVYYSDYDQDVTLVHGAFANLPRLVGYIRPFCETYPELRSSIQHLNGHHYERDPRLFNEFDWMGQIESLLGHSPVLHIGEMNKNFVFGGLTRLPEDELTCFTLAFYIEFYRHRAFIYDFTLNDDNPGELGAGHYNQEGTVIYDSIRTHTEFLSKCGSTQYEVTGDDPDNHGLNCGLPWCTYVGLFSNRGKYHLIITKPTLEASKSSETYINYKYHEGMVLPGGWTAGQTSERDALTAVIDAASTSNQTVRLPEDCFLLDMNFKVLHTVGEVVFHSRRSVTMTPDSAVIIEFSPA